MFISISPNIIFTETKIMFEEIDYTKLFSETDGIIILHYLWGSNLGPPTPVTSAVHMGKIKKTINIDRVLV